VSLSDSVGPMIVEARQSAERGDFASAIAAQEQVVESLRQQGEGVEAAQILFVQLANLANYYAPVDRYQDALPVLEEAIGVGERIEHPQLETVKEMLESVRQIAALSPEELAQMKAEQEQEANDQDAEMQAQLAAMPPEQRAQMEAAMREFQSKSPEEQAEIVQGAQIQSLADQVRDASIACRRGQIPREEFLPQLEQLAAQIENEQPKNSPWGELTAFIRAIIALLRGRTSLILIPGQSEPPPPPVPGTYAAHFAAIQKG
jgi:hypothetical protein